MHFHGMAGYYRKFCPNFSTVTQPLTELLQKNVKFIWTERCQSAFNRLKALLQSAPVLSAPDFSRPFKLAVDASDIAAGAVLLQEDDDEIDHPVAYFPRKFNQHQRNYSTVEKDCLALIFALQHFDVYVSSAGVPIEVFSDHNPLVKFHPPNEGQESTFVAMELDLIGIQHEHTTHKRTRQLDRWLSFKTMNT